MARKISPRIWAAIIGGSFLLVGGIVGPILTHYLKSQKGNAKVEGVNIEEIKGGTVNIFLNVKEDEFNEKLLEEKLASEKAEKAKAFFAAGNYAFQLGEKHLSLREFDEAIQKFRESLEYLSEDSEARADVYYNLGNTYFRKRMWTEAKAAFEKSIEISKKKKDLRTLGSAYNNLGMVFFSIGNFQEALQYLLSALKTFQQIENRPGAGATLNNIGGVYYKQGKYPEALEYYLKALRISQEVGDRHSEAVMLGSIAKIREAMGEIEEAIRLMEKVVEIDKETQSPDLATHTTYLEELKRRLKSEN